MTIPIKTAATENMLDDISRGLTSPYICGPIRRHPTGDYPAWEFLEAIPFGRLVHLWKHCADSYDNRGMRKDFYMLQSVKGLRNACAHNSCVINDMRRGTLQHTASHVVARELGNIGISRSMNTKKLSDERFIQIATTLYMHQRVASSGLRKMRGHRLRELEDRM
jgi:abortive infection bacteriophage resistance protein